MFSSLTHLEQNMEPCPLPYFLPLPFYDCSIAQEYCNPSLSSFDQQWLNPFLEFTRIFNHQLFIPLAREYPSQMHDPSLSFSFCTNDSICSHNIALSTPMIQIHPLARFFSSCFPMEYITCLTFIITTTQWHNPKFYIWIYEQC